MMGSILVRVALKTLEHNRWGWRNLGAGLFLKRANAAAKCASLIAHDRLLCGDVLSRGLPSFMAMQNDQHL